MESGTDHAEQWNPCMYFVNFVDPFSCGQLQKFFMLSFHECLKVGDHVADTDTEMQDTLTTISVVSVLTHEAVRGTPSFLILSYLNVHYGYVTQRI